MLNYRYAMQDLLVSVCKNIIQSWPVLPESLGVTESDGEQWQSGKLRTLSKNKHSNTQPTGLFYEDSAELHVHCLPLRSACVSLSPSSGHTEACGGL